MTEHDEITADSTDAEDVEGPRHPGAAGDETVPVNRADRRILIDDADGGDVEGHVTGGNTNQRPTEIDG